MASPANLCSSCLRAARQSISRNTPPSSLRNYVSKTSSTAGGAVHPQPLYLEFLAPPTWKRKSYTTLSSRPTASSVLRPLLLRRPLTTVSANAATPSATPSGTPTSSAPPSSLARAVLHPRTDSSGKPMLISITPRAASRLSSISLSDKNPSLALRVTVESGGCHGFQYLMSLTDLSTSPAAEEDTVFEGEKGAKVVIDESSLELLNGSTVDYTMELIGSQFKVTGIPGATSSCGCGTSFDIKLD